MEFQRSQASTAEAVGKHCQSRLPLSSSSSKAREHLGLEAESLLPYVAAAAAAAVHHWSRAALYGVRGIHHRPGSRRRTEAEKGRAGAEERVAWGGGDRRRPRLGTANSQPRLLHTFLASASNFGFRRGGRGRERERGRDRERYCCGSSASCCSLPIGLHLFRSTLTVTSCLETAAGCCWSAHARGTAAGGAAAISSSRASITPPSSGYLSSGALGSCSCPASHGTPRHRHRQQLPLLTTNHSLSRPTAQ